MIDVLFVFFFFFFKQKTAYEMCGRDWSSDVCSSDLRKQTGTTILTAILILTAQWRQHNVGRDSGNG